MRDLTLSNALQDAVRGFHKDISDLLDSTPFTDDNWETRSRLNAEQADTLSDSLATILRESALEALEEAQTNLRDLNPSDFTYITARAIRTAAEGLLKHRPR